MIGKAWVAVQQVVGGHKMEVQIPYHLFVSKLLKQESFRHMVDHMRALVSEEAGEISGALKKHVVYGIPLDTVMKDGQTLEQNIIEEMGDLFFGLQALINLFGLDIQEILSHNAQKLSTRYSELTYRVTDAQQRAVKTEGN